MVEHALLFGVCIRQLIFLEPHGERLLQHEFGFGFFVLNTLALSLFGCFTLTGCLLLLLLAKALSLRFFFFPFLLLQSVCLSCGCLGLLLLNSPLLFYLFTEPLVLCSLARLLGLCNTLLFLFLLPLAFLLCPFWLVTTIQVHDDLDGVCCWVAGGTWFATKHCGSSWRQQTVVDSTKAVG